MKHAEDVPRTFGEAVKAGRTKMGLSQRALGVKMTDLGIPMDATAITRLENNQREPRFSEGIALSRFLGFDPFLYAPGGFSYAGLEAKVVAAYKDAGDALESLLHSAGEAIGLHNMLEQPEDRAERSEVLASLLSSIQQEVGYGEPQWAEGSLMETFHERFSEGDGRTALEVLRQLLKETGILSDLLQIYGVEP